MQQQIDIDNEHRPSEHISAVTKTTRRQPVWLGIVIGGAIPVLVLVAAVYHLSAHAFLPPVIIGLWILGSVALWQHANATAPADAWWQDDSCSGWRGY